MLDKRTPIKSGYALLIISVLSLLAKTASGTGFYFPEVGTPSSLGTGGVANPTNVYGADTAWTNPAGMTALDEDRIFAGLQILLPKMEFDPSIAGAGGSDGGNAGETAAIPSFFYMKKLSDPVRLGFSVTAPFGGGVDYGDDFAGRYETINAFLQGLAFSPSLGYEVNDQLSLGGGVSIVYTHYEQEFAVNPDLFATADGGDGKVKFEDADDWGYQPFLGLTYRPFDKVLFGIVYRAEMDVDLEGDVKYRNLESTPAVDEVAIAWDNPQTLEAGISYELTDTNTLFFNAGWQDWSAFSDNELAFTGAGVSTVDRNWKDTWHMGVAISHLEDRQGYTFGFSYESSPVDNDDRTFDLPIDELYRFSASYTWNGKGGLDYSIGASLTMFGDSKIDNTVQGVRVRGDFDNNYILFLGGTLRYVF